MSGERIEPDAIYTAAEAAGLMRLKKPELVYRMLARGELRGRRLSAGSKAWRISGRALLEWANRPEGEE